MPKVESQNTKTRCNHDACRTPLRQRKVQHVIHDVLHLLLQTVLIGRVRAKVGEYGNVERLSTEGFASGYLPILICCLRTCKTANVDLTGVLSVFGAPLTTLYDLALVILKTAVRLKHSHFLNYALETVARSMVFDCIRIFP